MFFQAWDQYLLDWTMYHESQRAAQSEAEAQAQWQLQWQHMQQLQQWQQQIDDMAAARGRCDGGGVALRFDRRTVTSGLHIESHCM